MKKSRLLYAGLASFVVVHTAPANEVTWNGGAGGSWDWGNGANWVGGSAPEVDNNSVVHFAAADTTGGNTWNNLGWWHSYHQIIFDAGTASFYLHGDEVTLAPNGAAPAQIQNNSSNNQTLQFYAMSLRGGTIISAASGDLEFSINGTDPIWIDSSDLGSAVVINGGNGHSVVFNKAIQDGSGTSGKLVLDANNTLKLPAADTYSGGTTLNAGVVEVQNNQALGTGTVQVNSGAWLSIQESHDVANAITLNGGTLGWHYTSGAGIYSGPVTLNATSTVSLANYYGYGAVSGTISGSIAGTGGLIVNDQDRGGSTQTGGTLYLTATNSYTGNTTVASGTLSLGNGTSNTSLADSAEVIVATGAKLNLNYAGTDTIDKLSLGGAWVAAGVYGASHPSGLITGSGTLTVTHGTYDTWATGFAGFTNTAFEVDFDHDGIANGLEWVLGGNPTTPSSGVSPTATRNGAGGLVLEFSRAEDAIAASTLTVEYAGGLSGAWASVVVSQAGGSYPNGVTVAVDQAPSPDHVTVTIPATNAVNGKIFARLKAVQN